jgi:polysaccharide export outer membrane protein
LKRVFFLLAIAVLLCGAAVASALEQEYQIGEGDLLKVTVYANPDLDTVTRVSGEGRITFPLIGEVAVNGMTTAQAQKLIADKLRGGFIKKPEVSVFIQEYKSKKVTTLGEFIKPGLIELRGNATLMEVISNAGGVTANAGDTLVIKRKILKPGAAPSEDETITVPLLEFLEGRATGGQVMVADGDSIYVPRAAFAFVSGAVRTPGVYKITQGLTVLKAITLAGGFTQRAAKGKVSVIRKTAEGEQSSPARLEDLVQPDDVVVVPESLF